MFFLRILLLLLVITATLTQHDFNVGDAVVPVPISQKPKEQPVNPKKPGSDDPKKPSSGDSGGFGFNLEDALKPGSTLEPKKPAIKSPSGGGGGHFDDKDLFDVSDGGYKPDGGRSGGRAVDPGYDNQGGADQPQDPDLLWGQILKMLNANMPEEFFMWMSNLKQVISPLLERAMEFLQALP
ncbi:CD99 molecule isoform X3 [Girardinichthys multiradiatus]|uniref:CD99 molecule isoform X3 n=1 Tax=Girardinichthys multiradiatus TaxID=208333 RepID=UPI001FAE058C|nr:CD99 molecule isoform X3 [Girardinichthys multiradiatus]